MQNLTAILFAGLAVVATEAGANPCQPLADALKASFSEAPKEVAAGENLRLVLNVEVKNQAELSNWLGADLAPTIFNSVAGSSRINFLPIRLITHGDLQITAPQELTAEVPANFGGTYHPEVSLFATTKTGEWCGIDLTIANVPSLAVINESNRIDIEPPVVSDVRMDRDTFTPGSTLRVLFNADDKSPICTKERTDAHACPGVWDLELDNADGQHEVHPEDAFVQEVDGHPGLYQVSVKLPEDIALGTYKLSIIDVEDIYGNTAADLPEAERQTIYVQAQPDSFTYTRHYVDGDLYRYNLTTSYLEDGHFKMFSEATSDHSVSGPDAIHTYPGELIKYERLLNSPVGQPQEDLDTVAHAFPGYSISLDNAAANDPASMQLPSLAGLNQSLIGLITDLHTFFAAVSPQSGSQNIHRVGDRYTNPQAAHPSWADGTMVTVGEDCIQWTFELVNLRRTTATIKTSYLPPAESCLHLAAPFMKLAVDSAFPANNWQQVTKEGTGYTAEWGRESIIVTSIVDRADGKILQATISNDLATKRRTGCNESLTQCRNDNDVPRSIHRDLTLRLQ